MYPRPISRNRASRAPCFAAGLLVVVDEPPRGGLGDHHPDRELAHHRFEAGALVVQLPQHDLALPLGPLALGDVDKRDDDLCYIARAVIFGLSIDQGEPPSALGSQGNPERADMIWFIRS